MPLELQDTKLAEVERAAQLERAGIEYIFGIVEKYGPFLRDICLEEGENVPEESVKERLCSQVTSSLSRLEEKAVRVISEFQDLPLDINTHTKDPLVRMGWARYVPIIRVPEDHPEGARFPQMIHMTVHGQDVVNGWRTARGLVTVQEQLRLNREREERNYEPSATQGDQNE